MSAAMISLSFDDLARDAFVAAREASPALRVALLAGEQLRLPAASESLRVLSGRAWVSRDGEDHILSGGGILELGGSRNPAVVSSLGGDAVLVEIR